MSPKHASTLTSRLLKKKEGGEEKKAVPYWVFFREGFFELYSCLVTEMAVEKLCSHPNSNVII